MNLLYQLDADSFRSNACLMQSRTHEGVERRRKSW